ncbi:MAG: hydrogenase nickel incorporation protein HypB [Catonella sp.]|jgi:hydrogenase nickel incorporation protein HypB|nr:hydrogenase nickel incorporation protein HypB [Catonella sp.]MDY6356783.1 hydrogenase nickel incorporation protein HypB [Catonella sp.]
MIDTVEVKEAILTDNGIEGAKVRKSMEEKGIYLLNLMGSPGAGKTSVLVKTIEALKGEMNIGVMEADVDSTVDAETVEKAGARAIQLHTGGACHLDAVMTREGLDRFDLDGLDLVIVENVGNLVCPAEFDIGAEKRAIVFSVPEGDDKPLKYPLMFEKADIILVNKMDTISYFDFDMERFKSNVNKRNDRNIPVIPISAINGEGLDEFFSFLWEGLSSLRRK